MHEGGCVKVIKDCAVPPADYIMKEDEFFCPRCPVAQALDEGVCTKCEEAIDDCIACDGVACIGCAEGFELTPWGTCTPEIELCLDDGYNDHILIDQGADV